MRAPGEAPGTFALESAMDELAYELKMDPIELRLRNHADTDPEYKKPWSSKSLKECYRIGAEKFGWSKRQPEPRSMRDGKWLVGYGMATATYPVNRSPAQVSRPADAGRQSARDERLPRPRDRHVHDHDADRCGRAGAATEPGKVRTWRHADARGAGGRWLAACGERG